MADQLTELETCSASHLNNSFQHHEANAIIARCVLCQQRFALFHNLSVLITIIPGQLRDASYQAQHGSQSKRMRQ